MITGPIAAAVMQAIRDGDDSLYRVDLPQSIRQVFYTKTPAEYQEFADRYVGISMLRCETPRKRNTYVEGQALLLECVR